MPKLSVKNFLELTTRSKLVSEDELAKAFADFRDQHDGDPLDETSDIEAADFARFLIERGLITSWQSDKLLDRKYKGFFLGKYKLLGHLGTGGMSSVYLAEHTMMDRRVAIKVLPKSRVDDSSYLARFHQEAKAAARLDHANIVRAYDVDEHDGTHYLVMEFVEGSDLQQIVRNCTDKNEELEAEKAAEYIAQAARGLHSAHGAGLIHRDIKPANLLVDKKGTVKILDMGLALFKNDEMASLTIAHNENVLGTADYLAPEQALNSHDVDHRADIYSLGCTLYYLLTGHAPFNDGTLAQRIAKHQTQMPPDIRNDRPDCPASLIGICTRMIQKDADDRYQSAEEVFEALDEWLESRGQGDDSSKRLASAAAQAGRDSAVRESAARNSMREERGSGVRKPPAARRRAENGSSAGSGRRKVATDQSGYDTVAEHADRPTIKGVPAPAAAESSTDAAPAPPRKGGLRTAEPLEKPESHSGSDINISIDVGSGSSKSDNPLSPTASGGFDTTSVLSNRRRATPGAKPIPIWVWIALGGGALGAVILGIIVAVAMTFSGPGEPSTPPPQSPPTRRPGTVHVEPQQQPHQQIECSFLCSTMCEPKTPEFTSGHRLG